MAIRTVDQDIRNVLETGTAGDEGYFIADLLPFRTHASRIVDRVATCATDAGETLTSDELHTIETYLAAHLYSLKDPAIIAERTQNASAQYQGNMFGKGLESTWYGQMALAADISGCLKSITSGTRVEVLWGGIKEDDQTDTTGKS